MTIRSWMAFGHPHDVHRHAGLVGAYPHHRFDGKVVFLDGTDNIFGALNVGLDGLGWEIFAGRNLLQGRGHEYDIDLPQHRRHAMEIPDIPYAKLEFLFEIPVDDFIRGRLEMMVLHPHEVLLCFVPGKDDDLGRIAEFSSQQAAHQGFA